MAPHSGTFAQKIPWMEEPGRLQSMGSLESDTTERLHFPFSLSCIGEGNGNPLQCSCLENPRDGKPGGLPSMGRTESDTTEVTQQQQQQHTISGGVKWYSCYRKQCDRFSKKLRTYSVLGIYSKSKVEDTCTLPFTAAWYSSRKVEPTKCPFINMWCRKNVMQTYSGLLSSLEQEGNSEAAAWINLEDVTPSEVNQMEKGKYCIIPLIQDTQSSHIQRQKTGVVDWEVVEWIQFQFCKIKELYRLEAH